MYIKIENDKLIGWSKSSFDDSVFVNIDYDYFNKNQEQFKVINNNLVDISITDEYKKRKRLSEIDDDLQACDILFTLRSRQSIAFNGNSYKFEWTSLYQGLLDLDDSHFPMKIWDMSELEEHAVLMSKEELSELQNLLIQYQETAFQERKEDRAKLLVEKDLLEKYLEQSAESEIAFIENANNINENIAEV